MPNEQTGQRWKNVIESPLFDHVYITQNNPEFGSWRLSDVVRFCCEPQYSSKSTSREFDAQAYLDAYPDCKDFELHPLVHYLEFGQAEDRQIFPVLAEIDYSKTPKPRIVAESHTLDYTGAPMEMRRLFSALGINPADTLVTSPVTGPLQTAWEDDGFQTLLHGHSERRILTGADLITLSQSGARMLRSLQPTGVFVNSLMAFPIACAAQQVGLPYIWVIHEPSEQDLLQRFPSDVQDMVFQAMQQAQSLIFVSKASHQAFAPYLNHSQNQHIIPKKLPPEPTVTPAERDIIRTEFGLGPDDILCLSVGTFSPRKGQLLLMDALAKLPKGQKRMRCLVVGATDTEYSESVIAKAQALDPAICDVEILPQSKLHHQRIAVQRMFIAADVVIVTSAAESTPLTVSEAFAAGSPVICTDVNGVSDEVRHAVNGLVFANNDATELAHCITQLRDDTVLRHCLRGGAQASAHSKKDHTKMCDHYARLMQQAFV